MIDRQIDRQTNLNRVMCEREVATLDGVVREDLTNR